MDLPPTLMPSLAPQDQHHQAARGTDSRALDGDPFHNARLWLLTSSPLCSSADERNAERRSRHVNIQHTSKHTTHNTRTNAPTHTEGP